jgi:hypothetical protein
MGLMNRFNKGTIDWGIDTKDMKYIKLSEFKEGDIVPVKGLFINSKGNFEPHPVAISENGLIDLPMHQTDTVNEILASPEVVEAIKQGKVAFKVRIYNAVKYSNKECYSVEWVDME